MVVRCICNAGWEVLQLRFVLLVVEVWPAGSADPSPCLEWVAEWAYSTWEVAKEVLKFEPARLSLEGRRGADRGFGDDVVKSHEDLAGVLVRASPQRLRSMLPRVSHLQPVARASEDSDVLGLEVEDTHSSQLLFHLQAAWE